MLLTAEPGSGGQGGVRSGGRGVSSGILSWSYLLSGDYELLCRPATSAAESSPSLSWFWKSNSGLFRQGVWSVNMFWGFVFRGKDCLKSWDWFRVCNTKDYYLITSLIFSQKYSLDLIWQGCSVLIVWHCDSTKKGGLHVLDVTVYFSLLFKSWTKLWNPYFLLVSVLIWAQ